MHHQYGGAVCVGHAFLETGFFIWKIPVKDYTSANWRCHRTCLQCFCCHWSWSFQVSLTQPWSFSTIFFICESKPEFLMFDTVKLQLRCKPRNVYLCEVKGSETEWFTVFCSTLPDDDLFFTTAQEDLHRLLEGWSQGGTAVYNTGSPTASISAISLSSMHSEWSRECPYSSHVPLLISPCRVVSSMDVVMPG